MLISDWVSLASALAIQPRLYAVLLGATARDRKSTPITITVQFFQHLFLKEFQVCEGVGSAEGLAKFLEDNPKGVLVLDEFKAVIQKGGIKGSVLLPCLSTLFEKNKYENYTRKSQVKVEGAYLSMLAACADETFLNMWDSSSLDLGFLNRLFLLPGKAIRKDSIPPEIHDEKLIPIRERLKCLVDRMEKEKPRFKVTKKGKDAFNRWYENMPDSIWGDRLDAYAHRLMVLFAGNEEKEEIKSELVERVIKVVNWQMKIRE